MAIVSLVQQQNGLNLISKLKVLKAGLESVYKINIGALAKQDYHLRKEDNVFVQFKAILDLIIKITQDTKNDSIVTESGIIKVLFQLLFSFEEAFTSRVQKLQKKVIP